MAREGVEHVVEERHAGVGRPFAGAVEAELDDDVGFLGRARDARRARHRLGRGAPLGNGHGCGSSRAGESRFLAARSQGRCFDVRGREDRNVLLIREIRAPAHDAAALTTDFTEVTDRDRENLEFATLRTTTSRRHQKDGALNAEDTCICLASGRSSGSGACAPGAGSVAALHAGLANVMRAFVAGALACLVALAACVAIVLWREPELHRADPQPVIYAGHEAAVARFIEPLTRAGFTALATGDVQIQGGEIRVQLRSPDAPVAACALPTWAQSPGGVQITLLPGRPDESPHMDGASGRAVLRGLGLAWAVCGGDAASLLAAGGQLLGALDARPHDDVWGITADAPDLATVTFGILTPALRATGISPQRFTAVWFLTALAATLGIVAMTWRADVRIDSLGGGAVATRRGLLFRVTWLTIVGLAIGGAAARFSAAEQVPQDGDEIWAEPSPHPILTDDHDAWVHPPAFRTVQQLWAHWSGWRARDGIAPLRTPSVCCAVLALWVVAFGVYFAGYRFGATIPIAILALAPGIVRTAVLARPYALAALLVSVLAVALWGSSGRETRGQSALRMLLIALSAGLAMWVDVLGGLAALLLLAAHISACALRRDRRAAIAGCGLLLAALIWDAPILAGARVASQTQLAPAAHAHADADAGQRGAADLRPHPEMARGGAAQFVRRILGFAWIGDSAASLATIALATSLALLAFGFAIPRRPRRLEPGAVTVALVLALTLLSARVAIRDRNVLFFPHVALLAVALAMSGREEAD
ncbi:MAG: hypothetical protein ABI629_09790 [bacterium]